MNQSERQRDQYERIHDEYAQHYYDSASMEYRKRFIFAPLLDGLDLSRLSIADLACGDGHNSTIIRDLFPSARLHGFDISPTACESYRALVGSPASECDLLATTTSSERFDAAVIVGGLHHLVSDLGRALKNIHAMLKPKGLLLMVEPNKDYFLNSLRLFWYRYDKYFEHETEGPIDLAGLSEEYADLFQVEWSKYFGGPAYFTILNSLVFRMPPIIKGYIAKPMMQIDRVYDALPGKRPFPAFLARLRRV